MQRAIAMERSDLRVWAVRVGAVVAAALLFLVVWKLAHILLVLFGAVLLGVFLDGLAGAFDRRLRIGHGGALAVVLVALTAVGFAASWLLGPPIVEQLQELVKMAPQGFEQLQDYLRDTSWGRRVLASVPTDLRLPRVDGEVVGQVTGVFSTAIGFVTSTLVVVIVGIYLAAQPRVYVDGMVRMVPAERRGRAREVFAHLGHALRRWLVGRFVAMGVIAVLTTIGLFALGIPSALALGFVAGVLTFIPFIGPIVSVVPAAAIALLQGPLVALYVLLLYIGVQLVESNLITPWVEHRAVSLPPALLLAFQAVMAALAGLLGVLLATPLLVVIVVFVQTVYLQGALGEDVTVLAEKSGRSPMLRPLWNRLKARGNRGWHRPPREAER